VRRTAPQRGVAWMAIVGLLALGGGLAWWLGGGMRPRPAPDATSDPRLAYSQGISLAKARRFMEGLPLLKRAVTLAPGYSQVHHDYGTTLLNAVHEPRHHLGRLEFAVRSSPERVEMVREALAHLVEAERLAGNARDKAWALRMRAQAMGVWGFPWEALVGYRQAEWTDSTWLEIRGRADHVLDEMQHPERTNPPEP